MTSRPLTPERTDLVNRAGKFTPLFRNWIRIRMIAVRFPDRERPAGNRGGQRLPEGAALVEFEYERETDPRFRAREGTRYRVQATA